MSEQIYELARCQSHNIGWEREGLMKRQKSSETVKKNGKHKINISDFDGLPAPDPIVVKQH